MTNWGRRKDNKQAYPKNAPKGVKGAGTSTSPVSDVHFVKRKIKHSELFGDTITLPSIDFLRKKMSEDLKKSNYNKIDVEKQSFEEGFDRGVGIAEGVTDNVSLVKIGTKIDDLDFGPDYGNLDFKEIKDVEDLKEFYRQWAFSAENNDRQFSPFEFQAKELNERMFDDEGEQISEAFDAFDQGISNGVDAYLDEFFRLNLRSN